MKMHARRASKSCLKGASPLAMLLALAPLFLARAEAKTISVATTSPVNTATAGDGSVPEDITVDSNGSIALSNPGAAITLNSNNNVYNQGAISTNNVNGARGIEILGGYTGSVINSGTISLYESYTPTDVDGDGVVEGAFAAGSERIGILLSGPSAFTGDISTYGNIIVAGQDSLGVALYGPLQGSFIDYSAITVGGERSYGIRVGSPVSNDVTLYSSVTAAGPGTTGVSIEGDVGGLFRVQGAINTSGYRVAARPDDATLAKMNDEDKQQSGSAVRVLANLGHGMLIDIAPTIDTTDADGDGIYDNPDTDGDGIADSGEGSGAITVYGGAPALRIGASTVSAISLEQISSTTPYGFANLGSVNAQGIFDGVAATSVLIENATISGGILNAGSIGATAYAANATNLKLGAGANVPKIVNASGISAISNTGTSVTARAVSIEAGATAPELQNTGSISANVTNASGSAIAIGDASNTLRSITNSGGIYATHTGTSSSGDNIAIDLSAQTLGSTVTQDLSTAIIQGDVRFGSGADSFNVAGGTVTGNLSFGAGADALSISGGAAVTGVLSDSDSALAVSVGAGKLALNNTGAVTMSSLSLGSGAVLSQRLDPANNANSSIIVTGAATLAPDAQIAINLISVVPTTQTFRLLTASSISGSSAVTVTQQPFLYASSVAQSATAIDLTLRRKTASDLGLTGRSALIYEPFIASLPSDTSLSAAVLGVTTQNTLSNAIAQFVPQANGAEVELAQSRMQALAMNSFDRLIHHDALSSQKYFWAQEVGFTANQSTNTANSGFDAYGAGLSFGVDRDITKNGYVGIGFALSTGSIDPNLNFRTYTQADSLDLFAHGGVRMGPVILAGWGGGGVDQYKSERLITFTPDDGTAAVNRTAVGKWDGTHASGSVRAAVEMKAGFLAIRPEVSFNALSVKQKAYAESGAGAGDFTHEESSANAANASAIVAFGLPRTIVETLFTPELRLGVRRRITNDPVKDTIAFAAQPSSSFTLENNPFAKTAAVVGFSLGAAGSFASAKLEANADVADGQTSASGRLVGRIVF